MQRGAALRIFLRRLYGALLNGLMWSVPWALADVGIAVVLRVSGLEHTVPFWHAVPSLLFGGAVLGFVAGTGFSMTLGTAFRQRDVSEISVASFSFLGAVVAAVLVAVLVHVPMAVAGVAVPALDIAINLTVAAILGGVTAFGMIKLAKAAPGPTVEGES